MSLFDDILEIGAAFDWISPIGGLIGDALNGPSHTLLIPYDCGYSGREISRLLKRRGVDSWGHLVVKDTIMLTVRQTQARFAEHLLEQAGVPLESGAPKGTKRKQQGEQPIGGWISELLGE